MLKTYFITNDRNQEEKPSSTYCYVPSKIGNARYKAETNEVTYHEWWQYSTDAKNRDSLLEAAKNRNKFEVIEGEIGDQNIKVKNIQDSSTYILKFPEINLRAVELLPIGNHQFYISHFGHWIEDDAEFREGKNHASLSLEDEKKLVAESYDKLQL